MYFVDRTKIEEALQFVEQQVMLLENTKQWDTPIKKAALERIAHLIIEVILDVGNAMIDGFIMRDPGSYEDIIDILEDEKVITSEMAIGLKTVIPYRKVLVQSYMNVNHQELFETYLEQLDIIKQFPVHIREYLLSELGPVSAFKN